MGNNEFPLEDWVESQLRQWYWGFDRTAFPLNAQVWFPEGEGPFPLVLTVHGNHDMADYSEFGYAYLGDLLASRGYIFVSVDVFDHHAFAFNENFLSGILRQGVEGRAVHQDVFVACLFQSGFVRKCLHVDHGMSSYRLGGEPPDNVLHDAGDVVVVIIMRQRSAKCNGSD